VQKRPAPQADNLLAPSKEVKPVVQVVLKRRFARTEEELLKQVMNAPALALDRTAARTESAAAVRATQLALADGRKNNEATLALIDRRPDLAGLPLRRGEACRLTPRAAAFLDEGSKALRAPTLDRIDRLMGVPEPEPKFKDWLRAETVPVLLQMLMAEAGPFRELLAEHLSRIPDRPATEALAQLALFDLHPRVRQRAIDALATRPSRDYRSALLKGFEHPWPVVAEHAAEAIVALRLKDAVPALLRLFEGPDPRAPYRKVGSSAAFVREMVRVNHHMNCLLCHPPSFDPGDNVRGVVPETNMALDSAPGGGGYFAIEPERIFVRADITYLKQDFSAMLPVAKPGLWPALQRFDFFVRERFATQQDLLDSALRKKSGQSEHHKSAYFALRELTGEDPGPTVADWKKLVLGRARDARLRYRGFSAASALAVDDLGRAYVADGNRILRQEGSAKAAVWLGPEGAVKLTGLALDGKGRLLAARSGPADLAWIDPFDKRATVSRTNALPGRVRGLGLSPKGETLYVAQGAEVKAYPVESAGLLGKCRPVGRLTPRGGMARAAGLAVDGNGLIYVLNGPGQQAEVFGPEGASLTGARFDEPPVACVVRGEALYVLTRKALHTVALPVGAPAPGA
jgi:hypothetical protein